MAYEDVRYMVSTARDGMSIEDWRSAASAGTRLLASDRRATQLRYALAILRPVDGGIHDDGFLSDIASADVEAAQDLIYGRYLSSTPLAVAIAREIFHPYLERGERVMRRAVISAFLDDRLAAQLPATRARSRSAIVTEFSRAGVLRVAPGAKASFEFTGRVPSRLALFHVLRDELRERREATDAWIANASLAAALFAVEPETMRAQVEALVADGRLQRSYYAGEPRILAA